MSQPIRTERNQYSLFAAALKETNQDAIAKIAMHNLEHIVLIPPADGGLVLHTLYYPDELHTANRGEAPAAKFSAKELELARRLVNDLKAPFKPQEFKDAYRENVERLIEQKQKGQEVTDVKSPRKAPVIDLMEALKRSLKATDTSSPTSKQCSKSGAAKKASRKGKAA